jgi:hypothetical protein
MQTLASVRRAGGGGLAVVTTALSSTNDLRGVTALRSRYGTAALVLFERTSWAPLADPLPDRPVPAGTRLVRVTARAPFATAWSSVFGRPAEAVVVA